MGKPLQVLLIETEFTRFGLGWTNSIGVARIALNKYKKVRVILPRVFLFEETSYARSVWSGYYEKILTVEELIESIYQFDMRESLTIC